MTCWANEIQVSFTRSYSHTNCSGVFESLGKMLIAWLTKPVFIWLIARKSTSSTELKFTARFLVYLWVYTTSTLSSTATLRALTLLSTYALGRASFLLRLLTILWLHGTLPSECWNFIIGLTVLYSFLIWEIFIWTWSSSLSELWRTTTVTKTVTKGCKHLYY